MLKKTICATLLAATASIAGTGAAQADHHQYLYSYDTEYGYVQFYNEDGYWPVTRRISFDGKWYDCSFWAKRYSCEREKARGYDHGHGGGYSGGGYTGGGYSSGY